MAVTYATISRAATGPTPKRTFSFHPQTEGEIVTVAAQDYEHVGPYEVTTGAGGTFSIQIPLGTDQGGADLVWKIVETPVDRIDGRGNNGLAPAVIGYATIPASIGYDDLVAGLVDLTAIAPGPVAKLQSYVDSAEAAATASAAGSTASSAAASAAQTAREGAEDARDLATQIAIGDAGAALAGVDADETTLFRVQQDARLTATYVPRDGTDPGEGGFWDDLDAGVKIARVRDRLFVGDAAALPGVYTAAEGSTGEYFPFSRWMARESTAVVASGIGRIAVTGLSRASLSPTSPAAAPPAHTVSIGVVGFSYADVLESESATRVVNGWGGYFEGVKRNGGQATFGVEIDVGNLGGGTATNNPYTMFGNGGSGGTYGLVVASGGSTGLTYEDTTFGIAVTNNGAKTKVGLIFEADAITGTDGTTGTGSAIQLAKGHVVQWLTPESGGLEGARILSTVSANASRTGLEFANDAVKLSRAGSTVLKAGYYGGANNYASILSSATGSPLIVIADSDTNSNVDIAFRPKGTGKGQLTSGGGTERFAWNNTGIGFFGTTPVAKATVTGSRGGNAALTSLLDALTAHGLIANGTTA